MGAEGKLTHKIACTLYMECGTNVLSHVQNIRFVEKEVNTGMMEQNRALVLRELAKNRCRFVDPPRLDEWENQFLTFSDRTKVYVLTGRGGTGKSMWAVSYFARHAKNRQSS